ncbi:hypothetical protein Pla110_24670 [Polystyrenella longa]|uniref:Uncharacterized protein n=1 Tax=Polystyrenella longa TaxID=2528007 RepID=A0A518CNG4_9PLAN|nr:hypothetical protein [Polystyrenella longa]QDU80734.1 hypothetical protein Pla110_24670 [Polystyrenella longa]
MNTIQDASAAILALLQPLEREATELQERLHEIDQAKAPLEAALKALTPNKKGKPKAGRKANKPCARKADVLTVCRTLVEENPGITLTVLEESAKEKLSGELGFSLSGVRLRLSECLSSNEFTVSPGDVVSIAVAKRTDTLNTSVFTPKSVTEFPVDRLPRREKTD